jgi:hypothetical protein
VVCSVSRLWCFYCQKSQLVKNAPHAHCVLGGARYQLAAAEGRPFYSMMIYLHCDDDDDGGGGEKTCVQRRPLRVSFIFMCSGSKGLIRAFRRADDLLSPLSRCFTSVRKAVHQGHASEYRSG